MMVLRKGMVLTLIGAVIGLAGAFVLTRWMSSMLFGITASDPVTYAIVFLVSLGAALLACCDSRAPRDAELIRWWHLRYE